MAGKWIGGTSGGGRSRMDAFESFLLPDDAHRRRMLDMDRRLSPVRRYAVAGLILGLLISGPWIGWLASIPLAVGLLILWSANLVRARTDRPEIVVTVGWLVLQAMIALSALLAGAPEEPALPLLAIMVLTLSARVSTRGLAVGVGYTLALMVAVALIGDAQAVVDDPPLLILPILLVLTIWAISTVVVRSDVEHRNEAVVDPLTRMLNRRALENRLDELRQQAEIVAAPVAVVMIDIDHFKAVNDASGHAVGDQVLRNVADVIRKDLRAYELAYRIGGEEFLVLLPGASREQGLVVADRLRAGVELTTFANDGPGVTISCGVAATPGDEGIDFDALLQAADEALYAAKRAGRNRALTLRTAEHDAVGPRWESPPPDRTAA